MNIQYFEQGSPEWKEHACGRKQKAFDNYEDAKKAAKQLQKARSVKRNAYLCKVCNRYHIGRKRKPGDFRRFLEQVNKLKPQLSNSEGEGK